MKFRAMLFDFDGTLADSFAAITASVNHVRQGVMLSDMTEQEVRGYVGHGLPQLLHELVPVLDVDEAMLRYREHHFDTMVGNTRLYPGVLQTLKTLNEAGMKLGICSNKAVGFTKTLVNQLGLDDYISTVCGPEDAGGKPKPAPDMLWEACRRLGVPSTDSLYIGDMSVDVQAAANAKMPVWLVHVGQAGRQTLTDFADVRVLKEFTDVLEVLAH
jgi:HAD superfamily hydrolase (TIGR01662 family)